MGKSVVDPFGGIAACPFCWGLGNVVNRAESDTQVG